MNSKPVAWMFQGAFDISTYVSIDKPNPDIYPNPIPLYTHPVQELTDQLAKYKQVLESIANEYVELSHDKIKWQCDDHIKWAKEALK